MGKDTHAISSAAQRTALEVLAANGVDTIIQRSGGVTPTPVISRAILVCNRGRQNHFADGIVITPSHNPPQDGGFKYNPPNGGPADTGATQWIEDRANELLRDGNRAVRRIPYAAALKAETTHEEDFVIPYVRDLRNVVDIDAIRDAGLKLGVDPLGGAAKPYWEPINSIYNLNISVVNPVIDPTFSFMTVDHDGQIRMDCSSPYAMARLVGLKDRYQGDAGMKLFPPGYRASGLLLHATSLPSKYGIGDVGPAAIAWIDELHRAGQSWGQALPLGPTGYGNSPYQPLSSFAGNELLVSPEWLIEDGLLREDECRGDFPSHEIDYDTVIPYKRRLLQIAWSRFAAGANRDLRPRFEQFRNDQAHWLKDYALFRALKGKLNGSCFLNWPIELVERIPSKLAEARRALAEIIDRVCFAQFLIFRQGERLKAYARAKSVRLIGDLPFFVSPDSSDVWSNPEIFLLDQQHRPRFVAGVPPDYFSAGGQLWGNPLYGWDALRRTNYRWCLHFRGFAAAWHVPAGAPDARIGQWLPGPGSDFFVAARRELGSLPFIAEDLGLITPDVIQLRDSQNLPGMRVLQFALDGNSQNPHLPQNYVHNTVAYTGTHDNNTTRGWFDSLPQPKRQTLWGYLRRAPGESRDVAHELMHWAWSSPAALAIAPLQDLLNLGADARMNVPGKPEGNWRWRVAGELLLPPAFDWLRDLTTQAGRSGFDIADSEPPALEVTEVTS
jgi:4-alpha-glucanotransferase